MATSGLRGHVEASPGTRPQELSSPTCRVPGCLPLPCQSQPGLEKPQATQSTNRLPRGTWAMRTARGCVCVCVGGAGSLDRTLTYSVRPPWGSPASASGRALPRGGLPRASRRTGAHESGSPQWPDISGPHCRPFLRTPRECRTLSPQHGAPSARRHRRLQRSSVSQKPQP